MSTTDYLDAIDHLPEGATLVIQPFSWDDYECLLEELQERPHFRISYDRGRLEIMSPTLEHDDYASFIDRLIDIAAEIFDLKVQFYRSTTWRR